MILRAGILASVAACAPLPAGDSVQVQLPLCLWFCWGSLDISDSSTEIKGKALETVTNTDGAVDQTSTQGGLPAGGAK
jgi:hypothetical protein